jgi:hypothetical protein
MIYCKGELGEKFWKEVFSEKERLQFEYFANLGVGDSYYGCDGYNHRIIFKKIYYKAIGEQTFLNRHISTKKLSDEEFDKALDIQEKQEKENEGKEEVIDQISFLGDDAMHHMFDVFGSCVEKYNPSALFRESASPEEQRRCIAYYDC